ncbi:MAG: hypothetical protein LBE91_21390, partial [Tannerella sp.]|nr:hypothetical protein [Tannerella sp.]
MENKRRVYLMTGAIILVFLLTQCLPVHYNIVDNYYVDSPGERVYADSDFGTEGYYLWCNPGCNGAAQIDYVKSIQWDKKHIIVEQQVNEK